MKKLAIILGGIVLVILVVILSLPSQVHVEREIVINASASDIYEEISGFRNFKAWSPWYEKDTAAQHTFSGPNSGVGATMTWSSDLEEVGNGTQKIIEAKAGKRVKTQLDFEEMGTSYATFDLEEVEDGVKVIWSLDAEFSGIGKVFGLMMDKWVGVDYEKGLSKLKKHVESRPEFTIDMSIDEMESFKIIGLRKEVATKPKELSKQMGKMFTQLMTYFKFSNIESNGAPITIYNKWGEKTVNITCAMPVPVETSVMAESMEVKEIKGGKVLKTIHKGAYSDLMATYNQIDKFIKYKNFEKTGSLWEEYISYYRTEKDTSKWITNIYMPIAWQE